jgi:hypothetical protein
LAAKNALSRLQSAQLIAPSQPSQAFDIHLTHLGPESILAINFEFEMFAWRAAALRPERPLWPQLALVRPQGQRAAAGATSFRPTATATS